MNFITARPCTRNFIAINTLLAPISADNPAFARQLPSMLNDIVTAIETGENHWELLDEGCFKRCYRPYSNQYIVKAVSHYNPTDDENAILQAAKDAGVGDIFLDSITIPAKMFYASDEANHQILSHYDDNGDPSYLAAIQVQPKVEVANETDLPEHFMGMDDDITIATYSDNRRTTVGNLSTLDCNRIDWFLAALDYYGNDFMRDFTAFCGKVGICDLHSGNIGYLPTESGDPRPVILDWLSYSTV